MRLIEQSTNPNLQPAHVVRFTNASARTMDVYQAGCLALLKLKTRGKQRVLVLHVNIAPGRQAVVAGRVDGGRGSGGGCRKTGNNPMQSEPGVLRNGNPRGPELARALEVQLAGAVRTCVGGQAEGGKVEMRCLLTNDSRTPARAVGDQFTLLEHDDVGSLVLDRHHYSSGHAPRVTGTCRG